MTVINEDLDLPDGGAPHPVQVRIRLAGAQGRPVLGRVISTGKTIVGQRLLTREDGIDSSGYWSVDLPANSDISPGGTTWYIQRQVGCDLFDSYVSVPVTGGPYEASTLEDDPVGEIAPSSLSNHAADTALHGGGVEVDFKFLTTDTVVTGTGGGFFTSHIAGTMVTIPDLDRPVYLFAHGPVLQQSGGPAEQSWGIYPQGSTGVFFALDSVLPADIDTTNARTFDLMARLPAHSAGNYVIGATGTSGNLTARSPATTLQKLSLRAVTA